MRCRDAQGEVELHPMPADDSPELSISFACASTRPNTASAARRRIDHRGCRCRYHASPMLFSDGMGDFESPARRGSLWASQAVRPGRGSRESEVSEGTRTSNTSEGG